MSDTWLQLDRFSRLENTEHVLNRKIVQALCRQIRVGVRALAALLAG